MSQENVEVVRRVYELWNRGDLDAAVEMLDPHVVWNAYVHLPDSRPRHGVHEVQRWAREFAEAWAKSRSRSRASRRLATTWSSLSCE